VPSHRLVRKDHLVIIAVVSTLVITISSISNNGYFDMTKVVYGQPDSNQTNSNTTDSVNLQDIPLEKVHVGDIDVAYKMFGKGDPIILIPGGSDNMDAWDPTLMKTLSSNHTVIVFDPRGIGNTTIGSKPYTPSQLANDTTGLMDVLKIPKAGVTGYSLGSYIAQQVTMMHPGKVNSLVLIGSSCGGKDHTPKPPEFIKLQSDIVNKGLNHIPVSHEELQALNVASLGQNWIRMHPESSQLPENITSLQQLKPGLPPEVANNQNNVGKQWEDNPNWSGTCDALAKLDKPTLVITGTDDNFYQPHVNSLKIAEKVPGAWLVQIKNASHAVVNQYPAEVGKIMNTFLSTTSPKN
jgi:pimeloyl-ACP methyl ester carboxylesterase